MEKESLTRFGVSMPDELIRQFDRYLAQEGYDNRSEAIRDLIRKALLQQQSFAPDRLVAGTVVLVYDHHAGDLPGRLTELQHRYHHDIISTMHVHLNHSQCLEILIVRGLYGKLQELHRSIQVNKGVFYAELSVTCVMEEHSGDHDVRSRGPRG